MLCVRMMNGVSPEPIADDTLLLLPEINGGCGGSDLGCSRADLPVRIYGRRLVLFFER